MDFINNRGVDGIPHLKDDRFAVWGQFGVNGTPGWATIDAAGNVNTGSGSLPSSVINGDWAS